MFFSQTTAANRIVGIGVGCNAGLAYGDDPISRQRALQSAVNQANYPMPLRVTSREMRPEGADCMRYEIAGPYIKYPDRTGHFNGKVCLPPGPGRHYVDVYYQYTDPEPENIRSEGEAFIATLKIDPLSIGERYAEDMKRDFGGESGSPELRNYINQVGMRLARASADPTARYNFVILNSPQANAFGSPGGYVFITRGLLLLLRNEAQLACVLGHEIGHVQARHMVRKVTSEPPPSELNALLIWMRRREEEADQIGIKLVLRAGYAADQMPAFLKSMRDYADLEERAKSGPADLLDEFLFPDTLTRYQRALEMTSERRPIEPIVGEREYMEHIDGLPEGDDLSIGAIRGGRFVRPSDRVSMQLPRGFDLLVSKDGFGGANSDGASISFTTASPFTEPLEQRLQSAVDSAGNDVPRLIRRHYAGGYEAVSATITLPDGSQEVIALIRVTPGQTYILEGNAPAAAAGQLLNAIEQAIASFRIMTPAEAAAFKPRHIAVETVRRGQTAAKLAAQSSFDDHQLERFEIINGLAPGAPLKPGQMVKLVVE